MAVVSHQKIHIEEVTTNLHSVVRVMLLLHMSPKHIGHDKSEGNLSAVSHASVHKQAACILSRMHTSLPGEPHPATLLGNRFANWSYPCMCVSSILEANGPLCAV